MEEKSVVKIFPAIQDDVADLLTFRALPVPGLPHLNPFLYLNHHGPQNFEENNRGLPFAPHPHRGFETVTVILEGDVAHRDSSGGESVILAGGVQWMTAGSGIVHEEVSSDHFRRAGGGLELLQLWVNLPARLKFTPPRYLGLQRHEIPVYQRDNGRVEIKLIAGNWEGNTGPCPILHPMMISLIGLSPGGAYGFQIPDGNEVFFYVISGGVGVNGVKTRSRETVTFSRGGQVLNLQADKGARILLGHAPTLSEPIAAYGPFVMNNSDEITQAISDFRAGKFL